jgi:phenylacetate-CoA ligase
MKKLFHRISASIFFILERTFNKDAKGAYKLIYQRDTLSIEELQNLRNRYFRDLIRHSYQNVPYYRKVMVERGLTPSDFITIEDVKKLPLLTKDVIRKEKENLKATNISDAETFETRSGGTTGEPILSVLDKNAYYIEYFAYWRGLKWMGWKPSVGIIKLFGGSLGTPSKPTLKNKVRNFLLHQLFLPAFELNEENVDAYLKSISIQGESVLIGYAHALYSLACLAENKDLSAIRLTHIYSTAEQMPEAWAKKISEVFQCSVQSFYGCGEINSLGFQIAQNGGYKIPLDHVYLENISDKGFPENTIAITALHNFAKPFIRYVNGDLGTINDGIITNLEGRSSDMLITSQGQKISPSIVPHAIFVTGLSVKKYQLIQYALNEFTFKYEGENGELNQGEKDKLIDILSTHLGKDIQLFFEETTDFILSPQHKHRVIINLIK